MLQYYFVAIKVVESIFNILMVAFLLPRNIFTKVVKKKDVGVIHVLGNGPSLKTDIDEVIARLKESKDDKVMVVNSFASDPLFELLQPSYYVLVDPVYFEDSQLERIILLKEKLLDSLLNKTKWPLNLFVPVTGKKSDFIKNLSENKNIKVFYFKNSPVIGGSQRLNNFLFKNNLANPLYQNVLMAGIFLSLKIGFSKILVRGADHSWHEGFDLRKDNNIYILDEHFYSGENNKAFLNCNAEGVPNKVHEEFLRLSRVFKIYHSLESFSKDINSEIINLSSKTWIDAFKRNDI